MDRGLKRGPCIVSPSRNSSDLDNMYNSRETREGKTKNIQMILNYISVSVNGSNFLSVRAAHFSRIYINSIQLDRGLRN